MTTLSLELSKELQEICKEKHITMPESDFTFVNRSLYTKVELNELKDQIYINQKEFAGHCVDAEDYVFTSAYTLCELLDWLPSKMQDKYATYMLQVTKLNDGYDVGYNKDYADSPAFATYWDLNNPANACGKLLIWLIKEGLIK